MNLRHLTNATLLADTKLLARTEREVTIKILHHIKEIERRKLYADLGFSSLFDYCLRDLGYSESSATRRIRAARMLGDLPELEIKIQDGSLNLSNINQAIMFFKNNDIETKDQKIKILSQIENLSYKECEKELMSLGGIEKVIIKDNQKRLSTNQIRICVTLEEKTSENFEELKNLFGRDKPLNGLFDFMINAAKQELEKKKFHLYKRSRASQPISNVNRVITAAIKREVYLRDQRCTQCGTTHRLQFDHQIPFALGGNSTSKNIRLLCFNCNQRARIRNKL